MNDREVNPSPADAQKCPQCGTPLPLGALRDEIAQTLGDPSQVDEEMRALFGAVDG